MKDLIEVCKQMAAGEPTGPAGLILIVLLAMGAIAAITWAATKVANMYGALRYRDAEQRKKFLEGDE